MCLALASPVNAALVAHWKLDDGAGTTAVDSSGNGHDGTLLAAPQWVAGKYGGALEFAGLAGQRVEMLGYDGVLGTQNRTVMAWIKTTKYGDWISWGQNVNTQKWIGRVQDNASNGTVGALRTECSGGYIIGSTVLTDGQWHHVASVLESAGSPTINDIKLYVDGVRETISGVQAVNISTVGGRNVWIGDGHNNRPFASLIDDVRIYDHAMTEAEVQAAMKGGVKYPYALAPSPKDGALHPDTWVSLSWSRGGFAVSHDVYIGDNLENVTAGTGDTFRGNHAATSLLVGLAGYPYPDGLVPGTTYYWRIDEVNNAEPNSPWKGNVWSFSIPPRTAYNPNPADGAQSVALDAKLTWTAGFGAKLHTIYFGDDFDSVNNASSGGTMAGMATYNPGPLKSAKVYYWRVDESDPPNLYKGQVWSFTTVGAVGSPHPSNGNPSAEMNAILTWTPGSNAASHQVYFGTDKEAMRKAGTTSPEYKGTRALGAESYDPGLLARDSTYYWQVDEVNNVNPNSPWKGPLWSFTTGDFLLVDDFESYNNIDPPAAGSHRIFEAWIDGFGTTTNGALVGNNLPPYAEQSIVHSGKQSMPLAYDNNLKFSEATATLTAGRDWTQQGVTELSLWFRGQTANAAEKMYVALNGTAVVYHDNPSAAQTARWTEWVIPLQQFASLGANLSNITSITIGLGTRGTTTVAGGTGKMYIDDIRLYPPRTAP
jgi:hypothetical protein